jgi:hypothetical protein
MKRTIQRLAKRCDGYYLSKEQEAEAKEYFAPYGKIDLTSHNFYFQKTKRFCANYLPEELLYGYVDPYFNDWREAQYVDNKCLYRNTYRDVPQPTALAMRIKGLWYDGAYNLTSRQELVARMAQEPEIVVKIAVASGGGTGVFFVPGTDFPSVEAKIRDDIVVELPIRQHEKLAAINESSVNTLRIVSLLTQEGVKFYSAVLRFGIKGARVDNVAAGGFSGGIDFETGRMKKDAYRIAGMHITQHPDSGVVFDDGTLKVTAIPTQHHVPSYSFLLEAEGQRILFTGDLKHPSVDFPKVEGRVDLAVCEGAHFLVTDYLPVWEGMDIGQIAIHHYVNRNVAHILKIQKELAPMPVTMVADGMEIRL